MKKINLYLFGLLIIGSTLSSCDVFDESPTDKLSVETIWGSSEALDKYVLGFYSTFKDLSNINSNQGFFTDAYTDLIKSNSWDLYAHSYNKVLFESTSFNDQGAGAFDRWSTDYTRIRRQNEFFRDVETYGVKFDPEFIQIRNAEVLFCRAYTYMSLIRVFGGVVLRKSPDPKFNQMARSSESESWNFVIKDLKTAAEALPESWSAGNKGRATKAAAYGLLSRAAVFAKRWDIAIEAAEQTKKYGAALLTGENAYKRVFEKNNIYSSEMLFAVDYLPQEGVSHSHEKYFRPYGDKGTTDLYSAFSPTKELVDCYEMSNGQPFSWDKFGDDPFAGREPRFYASILYNGAKWEDRKIETTRGGKDALIDFKFQSAAVGTTTGYYFCKFIQEGNDNWATKGSEAFSPVCRYAEVLLNKAEALAEENFEKNKSLALDALNEVRSRVNLPNRIASTKDEFMNYLRKERVVELAGEGFRYWDLRRWRLAEEVIHGKSVHGTEPVFEDDKWVYKTIDVDGGKKRIFYERYYAFSIPIAERMNNKLFGNNNPGW